MTMRDVDNALWFKWLGAAYVATVANALFPTVLFEDARWNTGAFAALQIVPLVLWTCVLVRWSGRRRVAWAIGLFPVVGLSGVVGLLALAVPSAMERAQVMELGLTRLAAYQTNGGATTSFGIIVRQELRVMPGVVLVRQLAHEYPAERVMIERRSSRTIRLTFPPYGDRRPDPVILEKRLLIL